MNEVTVFEGKDGWWSIIWPDMNTEPPVNGLAKFRALGYFAKCRCFEENGRIWFIIPSETRVVQLLQDIEACFDCEISTVFRKP